jgi:hypothetical protein
MGDDATNGGFTDKEHRIIADLTILATPKSCKDLSASDRREQHGD